MHIIKDFIDNETRRALLQLSPHKTSIRKYHTIPFLGKLFHRYKEIEPGIDLEGEKSYFRVEKRSKGYAWHFDNGYFKEQVPAGTNKHMLWCNYGSSILLTNPKMDTGGELIFRDGTKKRDEHYCTLVLYKSDEEHKVTANSGYRNVFLAFFE